MFLVLYQFFPFQNMQLGFLVWMVMEMYNMTFIGLTFGFINFVDFLHVNVWSFLRQYTFAYLVTRNILAISEIGLFCI